jgi:AcrR family transcriptional regulator
MTDRRTLTPQDWIEAGFRALTAEGPKGIRAEALARGLKVSKGSFYWHFADVPALKAAMLAHWEQAATDEIIAATEAGGAPAPERIGRLIEIALSDLDAPYGGKRAEPALRDWARHDPEARSVVERVELRRLEHLKSLFRKAKAKQPGRSARVLYAALIGLTALPDSLQDDPAKDLAMLLKRLLP